MATQASADRTHPVALEILALAEFDLRAGATKDGVGDVPKFTMTANTGSPMRLVGWRHPVILDMAGVSIPSQTRPVRLNDDANQGVGHTTMIGVRDGKLVAAGLVSRVNDAASEVVKSAAKGFPWAVATVATVDRLELVDEGKSASVNGKTFDGPVNVARKSTIAGFSLVDLSADPGSSASIAASLAAGGRPDPYGVHAICDAARRKRAGGREPREELDDAPLAAMRRQGVEDVRAICAEARRRQLAEIDRDMRVRASEGDLAILAAKRRRDQAEGTLTRPLGDGRVQPAQQIT